MFSFEYISYFLEACDSGSIQAAAKKLYLSSQGLGAGIQRLEKSLGMALLIRSKSGVKPTQFGKEFYVYASKLAEDMEALEKFCTEYREKRNTTVQFGIIGESKFAGSIIICRDLFNKTYPDSPTEVTISSFPCSEELFRSLEAGEIDAGWIFHREERPDLVYRTIDDYSPFMLICNRDSPLAGRDTVAVTDLKPLRFIQAGKTDPITEQINDIFRQHGFSADVVMFTTENSLIGKIIDNSIANILVRECYAPKILQYGSSCVVVPVLPQIRIANSVVYPKSMKNHRKEQFLNYVADYAKTNIYST